MIWLRYYKPLSIAVLRGFALRTNMVSVSLLHKYYIMSGISNISIKSRYAHTFFTLIDVKKTIYGCVKKYYFSPQ